MAGGGRRAAGERIGPFEIVRYLASGGMGDVYVARHTASGESVALKFLADASPANLERFEREGRIAASMSHPHIVAGRGLGRAGDGQVYIAMELLTGSDLDARLTSPGVTPAEVVTVTMQVCDALEYAHARRVVHRDLKPQNIFLCEPAPTPHGLHAKVLDFGVARLADDRRVTGTGTIVGSWSYMSPEQARAEPDLDARSDIWSLGVVLYECLSGRLPFDAPTGPGTLYKILFESPPDLAVLCPHLPRALTDLVARTLAKPRGERPQSAAALRAALAVIDRGALPDKRMATAEVGSGGSAVGTDDTVAAAALARTRAPSGEEALSRSSAEIRLTSVVFLREVRDHVLVEDVARELAGRVVPLPGDDMLVVFGTDRWNGDEPQRAVRLAAGVAAAARGIGVSTGRVLRGETHVTGAAVDSAVALSRGEGVRLDATTAQIARGYALARQADGSAILDPHAQRSDTALTDPGYQTPFLAREAELAMLVQTAERAAADAQPGGLVVLAAAGMGKSRLRFEAMAKLLGDAPDATFLSARCEAFRRDTPFAALVEALGDVVDASVARIFSAVALGAGDPVAALDRARASLETVLRGLAARGGPVVLAIDDVQWLDPTSQSAVQWVCENAPDLPLAVWFFGRPEARETAAAVLPGASIIELKPLPRAAAEKLLRAVAGQAPDAAIERAGGHPLFLEELGRILAAGGANAGDAARALANTAALPPSIESANLAQIDQLDPGDREFLKRASVFGRTAWLDAVVALGADGAALERLKRANLVQPRPRSRFEPAREFAFRSGVLQEVAYGLWTEGQRARLHERAASWLAVQQGVAPDELARHWDLAGERARAAEAYTAAAEASAYVADAATTCAHADRALELTEDPQVRWRALVARDEALQPAGDRALQRRGLTEMIALAATLGEAYEAEALARRCAFARITSAREQAINSGRNAIELAQAAGAPRWGAAAHNELALLFADEGDFARATEHAAAARQLAEATGNEWMIARSLGTQAYVISTAGDQVAALTLFEQAAARYARAGDRRREAHTRANAAFVLLQLGRMREAAEGFDAAIEASRKVGNARTIAVATNNRATVRRTLGDVAGARADLAFAAKEAERLAHPRLAASVAIESVYLGLMADEPAESLAATARRARQLAERAHSPALVASALAVSLRAAARTGAVDPAVVEQAQAARTAAGALHEQVAELSVALFVGAGGRAEDAEATREAIHKMAAGLPGEDDRASLVASLRGRWLVPADMPGA